MSDICLNGESVFRQMIVRKHKWLNLCSGPVFYLTLCLHEKMVNKLQSKVSSIETRTNSK